MSDLMLDDFIRNSFTFKECTGFVESYKDDRSIGRCGCGETIEKHFVNNDGSMVRNKWDASFIKTIGSTNAYGHLEFFAGSRKLYKKAEFVRFSSDDNIQNVIELMNNHWNLSDNNSPLLCISVIGGIDKFSFEAKKRDTFSEGLVGAVHATNAWVLTFGIKCGAVDMVGDAIAMAESYDLRNEKDDKSIRCIGIAPWGMVSDRDKLIRITSSRHYGSNLPYSVIFEDSQNGNLPLNKNHTHFLLYDNGIRNDFHRSNVAKFRKELEKLIATPKQEGGCGIPVVKVVLGGGFAMIKNVEESLKMGIPVVVCGGTGGAANILDRTLSFCSCNEQVTTLKPRQEVELRAMLHDLLEKCPDAKKHKSWNVDNGIELLQKVLQYRSFISSFDLEKGTKTGDFDRAILFALIKGATTNLFDQITIALRFGRIDVVKENILRNDINTLRSREHRSELTAVMTMALLENRSEFVEFMLEEELVDLSGYLSVGVLSTLYNDLEDTSTLRALMQVCGVETRSETTSITAKALMTTTANIMNANSVTAEEANNILAMLKRPKRDKASKGWINLATIACILKNILGQFESPFYRELNPYNKGFLFPLPLQELFLWAVLNNRHELAELFLRNSENPLPIALIGCNIYEKKRHALPTYDTEGLNDLAYQKAFFEKVARRMIDFCYSRSQWRAIYLLSKPFTAWGEHRCMALAVHANCREFISSMACQQAIQFEWRAGIEARTCAILLAYICPPLVVSPLIRFSSRSALLRNVTDSDIFQKLHGKSQKGYKEGMVDGSDIPPKTKLEIFYRAPRTKFVIHTAFYVFFLAFFSYTLLFGLVPNKISIIEAILMANLVAMSIETIRCFVRAGFGHGSTSFLMKKWFTDDNWHAFDLFLVFFNTITLSLRSRLSSTFIAAKTCYSILLVLYFMRTFQIYSVNHKLGPKSVMIFQMVVELVIFVLILLLFLVPYGVTTQALLYPYVSEFRLDMVKNALYYPYFTIYGEMFLDRAEAEEAGCTGEGDGITCPMYNVMVPVFLGLYMLTVGILLINLLIAIFSNVFAAIEEHSMQFWKSTMYDLMMEYKRRTVVPAPFSVIQVVIEILSSALHFTFKSVSWVNRKKALYEDTAYEASMMDFEDASEPLSSSEKDDHRVLEECMEKSTMQMQLWALRQIIKQNAEEESSSAADLQKMVGEIHDSLALEDAVMSRGCDSINSKHIHPLNRRRSNQPHKDFELKLTSLENKLDSTLQQQTKLLQRIMENMKNYD